MPNPYNYPNKIQQLLIGLFCVFALAGCGSIKTTKEEQENKKLKTEVETEIQLVNTEFSKMQSMYKILSQKYQNQLEKDNRTLSIALYYDQKGEQHMIAALSGANYQVEAPNEGNKKKASSASNKEEEDKQADIQKKKTEKGSKEIETLTPLIPNNYEDDFYIYTYNYQFPIGRLTTTSLVTLDVDGDHKNFRNTEAEVHLINHLFECADLSKNIYLFSSKAICPSCGGIRYALSEPGPLKAHLAKIDSHNIFKGNLITGNDDNVFNKMDNLIGYSVNEDFKITKEYVHVGALGQFAGFLQSAKGKLYVAEENLTTGDLYKWDYNDRTGKMCKLYYKEDKNNWAPSTRNF